MSSPLDDRQAAAHVKSARPGGLRQAVRRADRRVERAARRAEKAARALAKVTPGVAGAGVGSDSPKEKDWAALARSLARLRAAGERIEGFARLWRGSTTSWPMASEVAAERHPARPLQVEELPREDDAGGREQWGSVAEEVAAATRRA